MLTQVREELDLCKLVYFMDRDMIASQAYANLFTLLSEAINSVGHSSSDTPLRPISDVKALLARENGDIVSSHPINLVQAASEDCKGYMGDITNTLQALIESGGYNSANTSWIYDTIVPAFGGDKCPFLHNGRGLYLGHIEDMTKFMFWHEHPVLPRNMKSEHNNFLLLACEMKHESQAAFKV